MINALTSVLAFVIAISVLVAVHEYGHYLVGRLLGMKVLRYSIGFGKPLYTKVAGKDRIEYCISAIPLGGYVRFLDSREGEVPAADEGRAFDQRPVLSRIAVLLAGPLFNFLFAILAYWVLFVQGIPTVMPAVGEVTPGSYSAQAGLKFGDRIVAVGDKATADWESTLVAMLDEMVEHNRIPLTLKGEDGRQRSTTINVGHDATRLTEPGMLFNGLGFQPWQPPAVIGELTAGGAAQRAGLKIGDRITAVAGEPVKNYSDLIDVVSTRARNDVEVEYLRAGNKHHVDLTIGVQQVDGKERGLLGVRPPKAFGNFYYLRQFSPFEAVPQAVARTWTSTVFTLRMLGRMVVGDVSIKNISGPINIAQFAGESAQRGFSNFLGFLAIVSISLGVLNLLPIPILDGGQIVYQAIEGMKGSPLSERSQSIGQQIGVFALVLLMGFAFYNDIVRLVTQP